MRRRVGRIIVALAFSAALLLWGVTSILSYNGMDALIETGIQSERAHRTAMELELGFSHVKDAESAVRGYLLTGHAAMLADHQPAAERARQSLARIREAVATQRGELAWVDQHERLVSARLMSLSETLAAEPRGRAAMAQIVAEGAKRMTALRDFIAARRAWLSGEVRRRERASREGAERAVRADALGTLLGLTLAVGAFIALFLEAGRRARAEEEARNLSLIDELTGLLNRRGFATLGRERLRFARRLRLNVVVCYADIDGLKNINDTLGHAAGDRAITTAARVLRATFRDVDILGRLGGDEFGVLAVADGDFVLSALESRLAGGLEAANTHEHLPFSLSMTLGVVTVGGAQEDGLEDIMNLADRAMYARRTRLRNEEGVASQRAEPPRGQLSF